MTSMRFIVSLLALALIGGRAEAANPPMATPRSVLGAQSGAALALLPAQTTLRGPKATQRLLVEAHLAGNDTGDLTARAMFASSDPKVARVGKDGVVRPTGNGQATV